MPDSRVLDLFGPVDLEPLAPDDVVDGRPQAGLRVLTNVGETEVGVWEMTAGTATDTEEDEVFLVLGGEATVTFEDGEVVALRAGVAVRLRAGDRTTWQVTETLRKLYLA